MTEIDTNVSSYSLSELLTIVNLDNEDVTKDEVIKNTNYFISKFKNKNPELAVFFEEVQSELLQYVDGLEVHDEPKDTTGKIIVEGFGTRTNEAIYGPGEKQLNEWYENEHLTQSNTNQVNKITNLLIIRFKKIKIILF